MKKSALLLFAVGLTAALGACTPSMNFLPSSVVPAATGKVQIKRDKNENYLIKLNVRNLAPADRLSPPARTYIAWMESGSNSIRKLGLLEPKSRNLEAALTATAVANPERIFVTAENGPDVQNPGGNEVLATRR